MDLALSDKIVLITGGASGIGASITRGFLAEGAKVAVIDRHPATSENTDPTNRLSLTGDLTQTEFCQHAVKETLSHYGQLDVVINNAGVNDTVGIKTGPSAFLASLQKNLVHYYSMVHFAADALKQSRGTIINIGSKVFTTGQGGTSGYAASKGGVAALTREWALELAASGIRVNAVIPAEVWTEMYANWLGQQPDSEQQRQQIATTIPLEHRFTRPEEIADTVLFLASSRSSHTTGQILFIDGGYTHLDRRCTIQ